MDEIKRVINFAYTDEAIFAGDEDSKPTLHECDLMNP